MERKTFVGPVKFAASKPPKRLIAQLDAELAALDDAGADNDMAYVTGMLAKSTPTNLEALGAAVQAQSPDMPAYYQEARVAVELERLVQQDYRAQERRGGVSPNREMARARVMRWAGRPAGGG